jgi:hypothetical protein
MHDGSRSGVAWHTSFTTWPMDPKDRPLVPPPYFDKGFKATVRAQSEMQRCDEFGAGKIDSSVVQPLTLLHRNLGCK